MSEGWTTSADIGANLLRRWDRGQILAAGLRGEELFPMRINLRGPDTKAIGSRFQDVQIWVQSLRDGSRPRVGHGYEIEWREVNHRQVGRQQIPIAVAIPTEEDALRIIKREKQSHAFRRLVAIILAARPEMSAWIAKYPMRVLQEADHWDRILSALQWFLRNPNSGLYLRQVDIPGVHTKFIEGKRGLLSELLEQCSPSPGQRAAARQFESRFGLRSKPPTVRFRLLDPDLALGGLRDISAPVSEVARLSLPLHRVIITENEINGLALPDISRTVTIFGLGYGLEVLSEIAWLRPLEIHYWGDIDTHGFAMLDQVRAYLPTAKSLLMDRATLMAHRELWGVEAQPHQGRLSRLHPDEQELFSDLQLNRIAENLRLEQEHVAFGRVSSALKGAGLA